jgi:mono/diheme cytochrome c family protein
VSVPRVRGGVAPILLVLAGTASASGAPPRTVRDGVYTTQQAERGKQVYKRACVECHTLDWYRGDVMKPWEGAELAELYDLVARTMPQDNPGSLKSREYADLLAFILSLNGLPAGSEELPSRPAALKGIVIQMRSKP